MSDIPEARAILERGLKRSARAAIRKALPLLWRVTPFRRAPVSSRKVGYKLAIEIRRFANDHPEWSQQKIAHYFGINAGRVSEALHKKR